MTDPHPPSPRDEYVEDQAAAWVARRDRGLTPAELEEFLRWREEDSRHAEWLAKHDETVRKLRMLAHRRPGPTVGVNSDLFASRRRILGGLRPIAYAAAACIALSLLYSRARISSKLEDPMHGGIVTYPLPTEQRVLRDGSIVHLNRGAEVESRFEPAERRVHLLKGEATFSVAHDVSRPFVVQAGNVQITALGTVFNVNLQSSAIEVLVTNGKVAVDRPAPAAGSAVPKKAKATDRADGGRPSPTLVGAGHRAVVSLTPTSTPPDVVAVSPEEASRLLAWQPRELEFTDAPLRQVVAEFNRYNPIKIVIVDTSLGELPIGATLRSDNVVGFVRLLEASFQVKVERRKNEILLRRDIADSR